MSALILPSRFRQQPQYPARVKPEYSGGTVFVAPGYDAANGTPTALPSTLAVATTTLGKVVTNASQTSNAVVCKGGIRTANWSAVFVGSFVTGTQSYDTFAHFKDDGYALKFGNSYGGSNTFGIVVPFGGSYFSSISNRSGVPCVAAFLGTNGANYDCIVRWLDTNQVTVETGITFGGPILTAGTSYLLSEETAPYTCGANSTLALAGTIPRRMPVAEALSVVQNPWQIFKAPPKFYFSASSGPTAYTLPSDSGTFALTGTDATLARSRILTADAASFALTGTAATLTTGRVVVADSASFALTGAVAVLEYTPVGGPTYTLTADPADFALIGTAAVLAHGHVLSADSNSIVLTGTDVTLTYTVPPSGEVTLSAQTISDIADAVYARFLLGAAPVNVIQFNGNPTTGTGRPGDPVTAA